MAARKRSRSEGEANSKLSVKSSGAEERKTAAIGRKGKKAKGSAHSKLAVNSNGAKKPKEKIGPGPVFVFQHDLLKDFLKKNPKDQASIDAVHSILPCLLTSISRHAVFFLLSCRTFSDFQTAADRWKSLSDADKAPYVARYRVLWKLQKKAIASMPTFRKASKLADILGKLNM